ncbi:NADPH-dependent FMN reductase [Lactobacillus hominis]|uniref:NADPH-dependent FMN reductase n=1 Tax=Lactobacillus hominis DSM 23910 = CRBIP 24.179 TaxID=1423758 RepID=I7L7B8_9LACO|nr:NADPH-dependent FMN reductase [Lactobacillus hominis]KRM85167.1 flavin reductase [Lactobacillus hominis DSM 23910 = CRBIP 24.179]MCT3348327.1 NAD(P)H-dependent oxidoreductase [Lactobacillus hominis]CCI82527.1 NADPH-dependent FMN reductase [Lactobacillus hominis DSM 23910 = CRBIP 24.179]
MKLLAIVGSNADHSYNRDLLHFIQKHFENRYDIELAEVRDLPMFKEGMQEPESVKNLAQKVADADAVLIATPEQQHSVPSALKSALEWLSSAEHPFENKPVVIVGTSVLPQGSSRGQSHLKLVLSSPGFSAKVFNGDEFMMGTAPKQFDENGDLPEGTVKFLDHFFDEFDEFYNEVK